MRKTFSAFEKIQPVFLIFCQRFALKKLIFAFVFACFPAAVFAAASSSEVPSSSVSSNAVFVPQVSELFVIRDSDGNIFSEENLNGSQIIRFSLYFGLCDEKSEKFSKSVSVYEDLKNYCEEKEILKLGEEERGEAILTLMYEKILSRYALKQTKVDTMLLNGSYNCVSSSLLYLALASDFGLDARVQETSRHAFVTLYLSDGRKIDVETTNPYGFNPGTKKAVPSNSSSTRYATVPRNYYSNRHEISKRRAVTLVAKNLCADFNEKDDYVSSVPLAAAAYTFVSKEKDDARKDFDTVAGNFAVYADKKNASETGLDFLDEIFERYGKTEYLLSQYNDVAYNSAAEKCSCGEFEAAKANLEKRSANLKSKTVSEISKMIFESQTIYEAQNLSPDDGILYVQNARKSSFAQSDSKFRANLEKLEESLWSKKLASDFNAENFLKAAEICDEGLASLPLSSYLKSAKNACLQNHAAGVHNQIVPLVNARKYDEAAEILKNALKQNPESRLLQNDLRRIGK